MRRIARRVLRAGRCPRGDPHDGAAQAGQGRVHEEGQGACPQVPYGALRPGPLAAIMHGIPFSGKKALAVDFAEVKLLVRGAS